MADDHVFSLELADGSGASDGIPSPTHVESPRGTGIHSPTFQRRPVNDLHVETALTSSSDETLLEDRTTVADFLRQFRCYALMPQSSKVLVLDTEIPLRSVFQALEENDSDSAPLWDSLEQDFIGMITQTDIIYLLLKFERRIRAGDDEDDDRPIKVDPVNAERIQRELIVQLDQNTIRSTRSILKNRSLPMLYLDPQDHLYEGVETLSKYKVHRIAVIDRTEYSSSLLYILSPTRLIIFLMKVMPTKPQMFSYSLERLSLGTYRNLVTCSVSSNLVDVLKHLSHLSVFSCLYKPVQNFLDAARRTPSQRYFRCSRQDTLEFVLRRMMESRLRSLIVTDSDNRVVGIVALGDILRLFVL